MLLLDDKLTFINNLKHSRTPQPTRIDTYEHQASTLYLQALLVPASWNVLDIPHKGPLGRYVFSATPTYR